MVIFEWETKTNLKIFRSIKHQSSQAESLEYTNSQFQSVEGDLRSIEQCKF